MKKKATFALLILSAIIFHSCKSYKDIAYVQGLESGDIVPLTEKIATTINLSLIHI